MILNMLELFRLLKLDPAVLDNVQAVPGEIAHNENALEGVLAAVDFTADAPPGVHRVRRHAWGHALVVKIPLVKGCDDV